MKIEVTTTDDSSVVTATSIDSEDNGEQQILKLIDLYYIVDDNDNPIIYIISRDEEGRRHTLKVVGFEPYFCVDFDDLTLDEMQQLEEDWRVKRIEEDDVDDSAMKVVVNTPYDIRNIRDAFDTLEADVQYIDRFLIDSDIKQYFTAPLDYDRSIHWSQLQPLESTDTPSIDPRIAYLDIEVRMNEDGDGPSVVSERGTELAMEPITAITVYDNYDDEYFTVVLENDGWSSQQLSDTVDAVDEYADDGGVYSSEREMMQTFNEYIRKKKFDILVGWNSNSFDIPYIVNRCLKELDEYSILEWSPTKDVSTMNGEGKFLNSDLKGIMCFDLLKGFEKTQIHELKSHSLENVAAEVLEDKEKLDIGNLDDAWKDDPISFVAYSKRDVEAMVEIDKEVGVLGY